LEVRRVQARSELREPEDVESLRGRIAMALMILASIGALVAFIGAISTVLDASSSVVVLESWRMLGFLVFAGLFLLLALRPHAYPGVWELVFLHKAGMAILGVILARGDAADAGLVAVFDGVLAALILTAYLLVRGYRSWGSWSNPGLHA
jgi:hypothetical protein